MSTKKTYVVQEPVDHDGERYTPGAPIELASKDALPLLAVRAIAEPSAEDGQALQQAAALDLDGLDHLRTEISELTGLNLQLNAELLQAREDIQSLQTAKAQAASDLAELQTLHSETVAANSALTTEVTELQDKLAAATATKTTTKK
jgi:chromosome segregation ATPase